MESQDSSAPPHHQHHLHLQQPPHSIFVPNNPYQTLHPNNNNNNMMHHQNPFPFNPIQQQQQQQQQTVVSSQPLDQQHQHQHYTDEIPSVGGFTIEPARKKRGRPRKYSPDNTIGLGLSPVTPQLSGAIVVHNVVESAAGGESVTPDTAGKRNRGRPPGSGKRQLDALGSPGVGFTPHVITVNKGEDIASKIMAFSQQGPRTVCILSANGAVSNVTLRQTAMSGGTVTYEGRFEIISLSGSFMLVESNGNRTRSGALSVSLAGSDGRVLGGGVAGMLKAATPVQVVVGSFIADGKKPKSSSRPTSSTPPAAAPSNILDFSVPPATKTSTSPDDSSESANGNDDSPPPPPPPNHGSNPYANSAQQPIQNMPPMYSNMGWPNSMKMQ